MNLKDLQSTITTYQTKVSDLKAVVMQKEQSLATAQNEYDTAVAQGNIDNLTTLVAAITSCTNDLNITKEAVIKYCNTLPLTKEAIVAAWEGVYDATIAPLNTAKEALDTKKQEYMQVIFDYYSSGEVAEDLYRQHIALFSYIKHDTYTGGTPEQLLKQIPSFRNDIEHNYKKFE
jgi:hypothetical protein